MRSVSVFLGLALVQASLCLDLLNDFDAHTEVNIDSDAVRDRRGVIEEEKYYLQPNTQSQWIPGPLPPEDPTTKVTSADSYQTTERATDKPTGRGARASNENWIKLPYPTHDASGDILIPPQPSGELINSRMPRVNFVTQNKALEASESRNDKESIQRATRTDEIRTEFVRPGETRNRYDYKPVFPRQAIFYPENTGRPIYDRRYYPIADDMYQMDPYVNTYEQRYFPGDPIGPTGPRLDRYDDQIDNYIPRKPKRIIYYAHLPEVVRTPPSVDLRYRYSPDPYRPDDIYARNGRYDYRFRDRFGYPMLRKEERNYRDLLPAGTTKDKKIEEKVTPTPILPKKDDKPRTVSNLNNLSHLNSINNRNVNRNVINSHQYHDNSDSYNPIPKQSYPENGRNDESYLFRDNLYDDFRRKY